MNCPALSQKAQPYRPINNQQHNPEQLHHVHVHTKEATRTHDTSDPQRIDAEHEHTAHSQRGLGSSAWLISIDGCAVGIGNGLEDDEKWCVFAHLPRPPAFPTLPIRASLHAPYLNAARELCSGR